MASLPREIDGYVPVCRHTGLSCIPTGPMCLCHEIPIVWVPRRTWLTIERRTYPRETVNLVVFLLLALAAGLAARLCG